MQMTHKQWLFRNVHVHYKKFEGLTAADHKRIYKRVLELRLTDPAELLGQHQYLLDTDFLELGEGPTLHCQSWVALVESALAAARFVSSGLPTQGYHPSSTHTQHPHTPHTHTITHPLTTTSTSPHTQPTILNNSGGCMLYCTSPSRNRCPASHRSPIPTQYRLPRIG